MFKPNHCRRYYACLKVRSTLFIPFFPLHFPYERSACKIVFQFPAKNYPLHRINRLISMQLTLLLCRLILCVLLLYLLQEDVPGVFDRKQKNFGICPYWQCRSCSHSWSEATKGKILNSWILSKQVVSFGLSDIMRKLCSIYLPQLPVPSVERNVNELETLDEQKWLHYNFIFSLSSLS